MATNLCGCDVIIGTKTTGRAGGGTVYTLTSTIQYCQKHRAAPYLLDALKTARNAVHDADEEHDHPYTVSTLAKIDAAIAKAEGGSL